MVALDDTEKNKIGSVPKNLTVFWGNKEPTIINIFVVIFLKAYNREITLFIQLTFIEYPILAKLWCPGVFGS